MDGATKNQRVKIDPETREFVRYVSAIFACTQGEFVEVSVDRYLEEHAGVNARRVDDVQSRARHVAS